MVGTCEMHKEMINSNNG